jgi:hypothetical protein
MASDAFQTTVSSVRAKARGVRADSELSGALVKISSHYELAEIRKSATEARNARRNPGAKGLNTICTRVALGIFVCDVRIRDGD